MKVVDFFLFLSSYVRLIASISDVVLPVAISDSVVCLSVRSRPSGGTGVNWETSSGSFSSLSRVRNALADYDADRS